MDWREQFFSSIPTSSNCCPPHLLMKLTQEPGGYHTHTLIPSKKYSLHFFGTMAMQLFYWNHWIRNCNKREPIGKPTIFGIKGRIAKAVRIFYLQTFWMLYDVLSWGFWLIDYMPIKIIETVSYHKNTSLFFFFTMQIN